MLINDFEKYRSAFIAKAKNNNKSNDYIRYWLSVAEKQYTNNVPIILDVLDLSWQSGISNSFITDLLFKKDKLYTTFEISKHNGLPREIASPLPTLKMFQYWILTNILSQMTISDFAKAYRKGYSIKDNVKFHRRQQLILKLDIKNFFPSLKDDYIYQLFESLGYSSPVSHLFTNAVTLKNGLPQGAPTSPIISNILMLNFDKTVGRYCIKNKIRYTRYADDMIFSGSRFMLKEVIKEVKKNLYPLNLKLNKEKIRVLKPYQRQEVTGIVVNNAKISVPRTYRRNLRLEVHFFCSSKTSADNHLLRILGHPANRKQKLLYCTQLLGKINYVLQFDKNNKEFIAYKKKLILKLSGLQKGS